MVLHVRLTDFDGIEIRIDSCDIRYSSFGCTVTPPPPPYRASRGEQNGMVLGEGKVLGGGGGVLPE